jgi:hypothetical protein
MATGTTLTLWSVRVALLCYVFALALRLSSPREAAQRLARFIWTVGCSAYFAHVVCAFHFYHHWSHAAAYEATARDTARLFGWNWGGGLYFNYAFTIVWLVDVLWWWRGLEGYAHRSRVVEIAVQTFLGFMAFNGAVVFASGTTRWVGVGSCVLLGVCWLKRRRDKS